MTTIADLVAQRGGVVHKQVLAGLGATDRDLTRAVRRGEVRRPRRGWYSTLPATDPRFVAARVGGRVTGAAALHLLGAWLWEAPRVTVSVPWNASRLRWKKGVRVVWDVREVVERGDVTSVSVRDALSEALGELPFEGAVAVLDWALATRRIELADLPAIVGTRPMDVADIADWVDPRCESFAESIGRTRVRLNGHVVESQKPVNGHQRIDLVVDGVVGLEIDGRTYHQASFEEDRRKDLEITIEGRTALRCSYRMLRDTWERVELAIETAVAAHRDAVVPVGISGPRPRPVRRGPRLWRLPARRRSPGPESPTGRRGVGRRPRTRIATIIG